MPPWVLSSGSKRLFIFPKIGLTFIYLDLRTNIGDWTTIKVYRLNIIQHCVWSRNKKKINWKEIKEGKGGKKGTKEEKNDTTTPLTYSSLLNLHAHTKAKAPKTGHISYQREVPYQPWRLFFLSLYTFLSLHELASMQNNDTCLSIFLVRAGPESDSC